MGPPRGWHGLQGRGHRTDNRKAAAGCCPETVGSRSFGLPCLHHGLGLFPGWPAWSSRPNRAVRFVRIPAQPSWSLPLVRSCGLSAPARSHEPCSLGFHRVCLSAGIPAAVLSRYASAPSDSRCQPAVAFRSRGFSPPQRFAPAAASWACCIPLPARGSSLFRHPCPPTAETIGGAPRTPFQATLLTPFRVFPSPAAVPRHPPRAAPGCAETLPKAAWVVHQRPLPS